jgi:RNA polymerase sigma factor (sigma-70 family)
MDDRDDAFLTPDEEAELARRGLAGDTDARNRLILGVDRLIWKDALHFAGGNRTKAEEYRAVAVATLCEKFHQFRPDYGFRFYTWARSWVTQSIRRYRANHGRLVRIPEYQLRSSGPTALRRAIVEQAKRQTSLDAPTGDEGQSSLHALVDDPRTPPPEEQVFLKQRRQFVRAVLARIHPRYRDVLAMRANGMLLEEVGNVLGVTRERIRQLEAKAQKHFLKQATLVDKGLVDEIEGEVRDAFAYQNLPAKPKEQTMNEPNDTANGTAAPERVNLSAKVREIVKELGKDVKMQHVQERLAREGLSCSEPTFYNARRDVFYPSKPSANGNGTHKPVNRLPAKLPAAKASGDVRLDDLQRIKALAADVGGLDRLHALTAFLMDLTRDAA